MTKINTVLQKFIVEFIAASLQKQETMFVECYTHQKEYHTKLMVDFQWKQKKRWTVSLFISQVDSYLACLISALTVKRKNQSTEIIWQSLNVVPLVVKIYNSIQCWSKSNKNTL